MDTHPPLGFNTEQKLLINPYSFYVNCFKLQDLFADKVHPSINKLFLFKQNFVNLHI